MRRLYIEISDHAFSMAVRRALRERRSTRDQVGYDVEKMYESEVDSNPPVQEDDSQPDS